MTQLEPVLIWGINNHSHFLWDWISTRFDCYLLRVGILTCFNSLNWDPPMADSHYMQMIHGLSLTFTFIYIYMNDVKNRTGELDIKVILQTIKAWLWMTAGTSGLCFARFRRRAGQWNTLFTDLCASNLLVKFAWRNSCYCFCGMRTLAVNQLWHRDEDRAAVLLNQTFTVSVLG